MTGAGGESSGAKEAVASVPSRIVLHAPYFEQTSSPWQGGSVPGDRP